MGSFVLMVLCLQYYHHSNFRDQFADQKGRYFIGRKKRSEYMKHSDEDKAIIGKYASEKWWHPLYTHENLYP